jgi:hypothetical protein
LTVDVRAVEIEDEAERPPDAHLLHLYAKQSICRILVLSELYGELQAPRLGQRSRMSPELHGLINLARG